MRHRFGTGCACLIAACLVGEREHAALFAGACAKHEIHLPQAVIVGRYRVPGDAKATLRGKLALSVVPAVIEALHQAFETALAEQAPSDKKVGVGDTVNFAVPMDKLHIFDPDSEKTRAG